MHAPLNFYLESCLAPLAMHLQRPDVTDIYINRPGEIWVEVLGHDPVRVEADDLTEPLIARLACQIAAATAQGISREHPLLAASLPTGERVQIAMPPATRGHIAIAIRKHITAAMTLQDYADADAFHGTEMSNAASLTASDNAADTDDPVALLRSAVLNRKNVLISGGTSTGKTTFLNALLQEIPPEERLLYIEDTPELQLHHGNAVGLLASRGMLGEAQVTPEDLLIAALRMRPDRIILGEIRGGEAVTFLRAINTGHPGSLSTIHADSASRAVDQLALLVMQTGTRMGWGDVTAYVRRSIDVIVQLDRVSGRRRVADIALIAK